MADKPADRCVLRALEAANAAAFQALRLQALRDPAAFGRDAALAPAGS